MKKKIFKEIVKKTKTKYKTKYLKPCAMLFLSLQKKNNNKLCTIKLLKENKFPILLIFRII